jgi:hypothetical protein
VPSCERRLQAEPISVTTEAADVLDTMANPHPRMWAQATAAYRARRHAPLYWLGFLDAMAAATGYDRTYFLDKLAAETGE